MLVCSKRTTQKTVKYITNVRAISSSIPRSHNPNAPLKLDPSLRVLLKDIDMSLPNPQSRPIHIPREMEIVPPTQDLETFAPEEAEDIEEGLHRKSPAALFGSQQIRTVVLPMELQSSISRVISESDKTQLRSDAKRLFLEEDATTVGEGAWCATYDKKYRSWRQTSRHGERDGTAFASVALPSHYSAIYSVFQHLQRRLGPFWKPRRVIDWGAGTGSGLWASLYSFQTPSELTDHKDLEVSNSSLSSYTAIEKREGLSAIGNRLWSNINDPKIKLSWQKSFSGISNSEGVDGQGTLALSAFTLSSLPTSMARRSLVQEMWDSGAHVIVLIDHNTSGGFQTILDARTFLLRMGREEIESDDANALLIKGSHVVAPCPHDLDCPLRSFDSSLICGFSQRIQRPSFVRLTKHSGKGHEDIGYSYVIIRRGPRPPVVKTAVGRIGEVGRRQWEKQQVAAIPIKELSSDEELEAALDLKNGIDTSSSTGLPISNPSNTDTQNIAELLRAEAYQWPRLVFPPLKRNGHIILDSCSPEGKIIRMTIPKSQGKQEYYDARKSSWGDIFPHPPKNDPQVRQNSKKEGYSSGSDIGKRRISENSSSKTKFGYEDATLREQKKKSKYNRTRFRDVKAWD